MEIGIKKLFIPNKTTIKHEKSLESSFKSQLNQDTFIKAQKTSFKGILENRPLAKDLAELIFKKNIEGLVQLKDFSPDVEALKEVYPKVLKNGKCSVVYNLMDLTKLYTDIEEQINIPNKQTLLDCVEIAYIAAIDSMNCDKDTIGEFVWSTITFSHENKKFRSIAMDKLPEKLNKTSGLKGDYQYATKLVRYISQLYNRHLYKDDKEFRLKADLLIKDIMNIVAE